MADSSPSLRQRLEVAGLNGIVRLIGLLPYGALRALANVLGGLVYLFDTRGRTVALANLDAAFGETFSLARKKQIARGSYQTFARTMLELFWSPNFTREFADRMVICEGLENFECHRDVKASVIYPCLHFSNFEWLGQYCAYAITPGPIITQKFKNPLIGPIFSQLRASSGHEILQQERAMIRMFKHLQNGGKFGVLSDLNLDPDEGSVIIETFGALKVSITQIHAALALRTGALIVPCECRPLPDGRYRMVYHPPLAFPPDAKPADIVQRCWDILEPSIREQPECWLWSYKHWRFRPSGDTSGRYPFYANEAKRFDKLLKKT